MRRTPRVAAIHDLSGFGRCSLTVVMPVLSAMGVQCCPLPTAYLSTHTGGFAGNTFLDMTDALAGAMDHWRQLDLTFEAVYTGFMGSCRQMELCRSFLTSLKEKSTTLAVVDPVLGDHGRMYAGLSEDMIPAMRSLCAKAGLILPNTTEAALLLGEAPAETVTLESACRQAAQLTRLCPQVVVTGVPAGRSIACVGAGRDGSSFVVRTPLIPRMYHGTGDIFGAVVCGRLMQGNVPEAAVQAAAAFVADCIRATPEGADERLGVWLESALPMLAGR